MKVGVGILGKIVVDGEVDTFDIDTTAKNVGGDTDALVEFLEFLVTLDAVDRIRGLLNSFGVPTYRSS